MVTRVSVQRRSDRMRFEPGSSDDRARSRDPNIVRSGTVLPLPLSMQLIVGGADEENARIMPSREIKGS